MGELGDTTLKGSVRDRWTGKLLAPLLRQPQLQTPAVLGISLAIDKSGPDEGIDSPANRGCAPVHPCSNLVERAGLGRANSGKQVALLAHGLCSGRVAAQMLDEAGEARRKRAW